MGFLSVCLLCFVLIGAAGGAEGTRGLAPACAGETGFAGGESGLRRLLLRRERILRTLTLAEITRRDELMKPGAGFCWRRGDAGGGLTRRCGPARKAFSEGSEGCCGASAQAAFLFRA